MVLVEALPCGDVVSAVEAWEGRHAVDAVRKDNRVVRDLVGLGSGCDGGFGDSPSASRECGSHLADCLCVWSGDERRDEEE